MWLPLLLLFALIRSERMTQSTQHLCKCLFLHLPSRARWGREGWRLGPAQPSLLSVSVWPQEGALLSLLYNTAIPQTQRTLPYSSISMHHQTCSCWQSTQVNTSKNTWLWLQNRCHRRENPSVLPEAVSWLWTPAQSQLQAIFQWNNHACNSLASRVVIFWAVSSFSSPWQGNILQRN